MMYVDFLGLDWLLLLITMTGVQRGVYMILLLPKGQNKSQIWYTFMYFYAYRII